jgi:glycosyltransferase involved in cell wall biosynthesis
VHLVPRKKRGTDYFAFLEVARILRQNEIEILHTHNTDPFVEGTLGAILAGVGTIVHSDHARLFPDKRRRMLLEWLASHFAYRVVGVSEHTTRNLHEYERIPKRKLLTIPNGVNGAEYRIRIDKARKRRELDIGADAPLIGLGVRFTEQKGITYLLKAIAEVAAKIPAVKLVIAGEGPLETRLKQEAADLGLNGNVAFIGPRRDIPELLQIFDLYVLPSLWEGLPMVLLEAMAAGCPIIATDVGGNASAIRHGVNGSLVPPASPRALASEILDLMTDPGKRRRYAENGLNIFENEFSVQAMVAHYEMLYERRL